MKIHRILGLVSIVTVMITALPSCNDWLDILPNNEQVTDNYWKTKEDVEAVVTSGYYYLREAVPNLLVWGEVRGGMLYSSDGGHAQLQNFNLTPSSGVCSYASLYKVIGMANSVLKYAPSVMTEDDTYYTSVMNAHLCEAYFLRAYCYLILVKNYREVPLVIEAFVNDDADYMTPKSTEAEIIAQIKKDVTDALNTGAAKDVYEDTDGYNWQTKGRATKWALYALMADACLWNHDYDEAITYCNYILDAPEGDTSFRPRLILNTTQWYEIFYPGNSNESILELNWEQNLSQSNGFGKFFSVTSSSTLKFTDYARAMLIKETDEAMARSKAENMDTEGRVGRMLFASFVSDVADQTKYATATNFYLWKYKGTDIIDLGNTRATEDANFCLYRVPDLMLIKAEALIMKGGTDAWRTALDLINQLRDRACLYPLEINPEETDELEMLNAVMNEWTMEFLGEGKQWYHLLRRARYDHGDGSYKTEFINQVLESNQTTKDEWIKSVLNDENAWFMPIPYSEINVNSNLEQNSYYSTTK